MVRGTWRKDGQSMWKDAVHLKWILCNRSFPLLRCISIVQNEKKDRALELVKLSMGKIKIEKKILFVM